MSQIFLFTGENIYALTQERSRWVQGFIEKHGEENLSRLEAKSLSLRDLLNEVSSAPFIAEKRLVLISGIPKIDKDQIEELLHCIHPNVIVAFSEPKPDKRLTAVKEFMRIADVKLFAPLSDNHLMSWMAEIVQAHDATLQQKEARYIVDLVGPDQMLLHSELNKIATFSGGRAITKQDIDALALCSAEQASWRLMDLLAAGRGDLALAFAKTLLDKGENPHGLWSILLWMVSQLALVTAAVQEGQNQPAAISKSTGVPFPTARSLLPLASRLDQQKLKEIVNTFTAADIAVKTGQYRSTQEAPEELCSLIDTCIWSLASS